MIKRIKNISLFIITLVFSFGFILNANAESCGGLDSSECRVGYRGILVKKDVTKQTLGEGNSKYGNTINVQMRPDKFIDVTSPYYWDTRSTYPKYGIYCIDAQLNPAKNIVATRFLLDKNSKKEQQMIDAAVMDILVNNGDILVDPENNQDDYWARLMAIRAVYYTFGKLKDEGKYKNALNAGLNLVATWHEEDSEIKSLVSSLGNGASIVTKVSGYEDYTFEGSPVATAKGYYVKALRKAAEYASNSGDGLTVQVGNPSAGATTFEGENIIKRDVTHFVSLKNIASGGNKNFTINKDVKVTTVGYQDFLSYYMITKVKINDGTSTKEYGTEILNKNLFDGYISNDATNVEIEITVHFEANRNKFNECELPIEYSIGGSTNLGSSGEFADYVGTEWYSGVSGSQHYIGVEKKDDDGTSGSDEDWTSPYKLYMNEECGNGDLDCGTEVTGEGRCCDENNNLVVSEYDQFPVKVSGVKDDKVKACFVDTPNSVGVEDENHNSYELTSAKTTFCRVYCRETYEMNLPAAKRVNAGRYFTFKVELKKAAKKCYTSAIDRDRYKQMILGHFDTINASINKFLYAKAVLNSIGDVNPADNTIKVTYNELTFNVDKDWTTIDSITSTQKTVNVDIDSIDMDTLKANLEEGAKAADEYDKLILENDNYNKCTEWEVDYNIDPKFEYDYEDEKYGNSPQEMEVLGGGLKKRETTYLHCGNPWWQSASGTYLTDESYETCNYPFTKEKGVVVIKIPKCNAETGECQLEEMRTSSTIYRRSVSLFNGATYVPKTLYYNAYPSGNIETSPNENNTPIEHGLPVSLQTKAGAYRYWIKFSNIGEYYDGRTEHGRFDEIFKKYNIMPNGYVCAYLVNIPDQNFTCDILDKDKPTICEDGNCVTDCIGETCEYLECDGTNCVSDCVGSGCTYNETAGSSFYSRIVSLNEVFPNDTTSSNWSNEKGKETKTQIEAKKNETYKEENLVFGITITPSLAKEIREDNKTKLENGSYSNKDMVFEKVGEYENIGGYSNYLTKLIENSGSKAEISGKIADEGYRNNAERYFELWNGKIEARYKMGPSWK